MGEEIFDTMTIFGKMGDDKMFAHQRYAIEKLKENPSKSMLLCYAMGTGKTAILASHAVHACEGQKVIYMGPKSLHATFRSHIPFVEGDPTDTLSIPSPNPRKGGAPSSITIPRYGYVTSDAANVFTQMMREVEPVLGKVEGKLPPPMLIDEETGEPAGFRPKVTVMMDECHTFSSRVAKILSVFHYSSADSAKLEAEAKEAMQLYHFLCRDPRIRVIAVTGTPIKNHPFNVVPILNVVRREVVKGGKKSTAFSEVFGRFYDSFIQGIVASRPWLSSTYREGDEVNPSLDVARSAQSYAQRRMNEMKKMEAFTTRLRGLVAWYDVPRGLENIPFPTVEFEKVMSIPMKMHQWMIYLKAEERESSIEKAMNKNRSGVGSAGTPMVDSGSVYRSLTRQASNFAFLDDLYLGTHRTGAEMLEMMPESSFDLDKVGEFSCKIEAILRSVVEMDDRIHGIFSTFVHGAGLAAVEKCFDALGWMSLNKVLSERKVSYDALGTILGAKDGRKKAFYASLTGDITPEMKSRILEIFNVEANAKHMFIRVILYSGAAAHGLTFLSGRVIHFLEPQWDDIEVAQARERFIRIGSAQYLPPDQQTVRVYYYLAVHPESSSKVITTDQHLFAVSNRKGELNGVFEEWLKMCSTNCTGSYEAESRRDREMIGKKEVPPTRTFFRCTTCSALYTASYFLQELSDNKCISIPSSGPSKESIKMEMETVNRGGVGSSSHTFLLDPTNGCGWEESIDNLTGETVHAVLTDSIALQSMWRKVLSPSTRMKGATDEVESKVTPKSASSASMTAFTMPDV